MAQIINETINSIVGYLSYLRDLSRKISLSENLDAIFLKRIKNNKIFEYKGDLTKVNSNKLIENLKPIVSLLSRPENYDKRLFLGLGLISGIIKEGKKIAAPLLIIECNITQEDENGNNKSIELDLSTLRLNYELISSIIESISFVNNEEDENFALLEKLERESVVINSIEEKIDKINKIDVLNTLAKECFSILQKELDEFKDIDIFPKEGYNYDEEYKKHLNKSKSVFDGRLKFIDANHFFIAPIPSEISTYKALSLLIDEINDTGTFQNETLKTLFDGVFADSLVKIECNDDKSEELDRLIEEYLPISLSSYQKLAIKNAFGCRISYIQGPPGTGKSHTIFSIVLASILLGKKVLVVSQKVPAVEVIKEKVKPFLETDKNILPLIYFDKDIKQELKESIRLLINLRNIYNRELSKVENELKNVESEIFYYNQKIKNLRKEIEKNIELTREFFKLNEEFLKKMNHFQEKYYELDQGKVNINTVLDINDQKFSLFEKALNLLKDYSEKMGKDNILSIRHKLSILVNIQKILPDIIEPNGVKFYIKSSTLHFYLAEIIEIIKNLVKIKRISKQIQQDIVLFRKSIEQDKNHLKSLLVEYIKLKNKYRILKSLSDKSIFNNLETFSKMLNYKKASRVKSYQKAIEWDKILDIFPVWISEIRNLNEILPVKANLFDLVIVDESSQVNLAEIIPVFYRGKNICIVGDHKQLSLISTGLNFRISKSLDRLTWEKYKPANLSFHNAQKRNLTITTSSVLDFIRSEENNFNIRETMLDEHFRSLPLLAKFTNKEFYDGKLKIMTENPYNISQQCFAPIKVNGKRNGKVIEEEAKAVIKIIKSITAKREYEGIKLPDIVPKNFTIGVISMIRDQVEFIKELLLEENLDYIMIGTPEEFQGHEKDVIIFSLSVDSDSIRSVGHYENKNRFNVATSRAKYFTFFVYSGLPANFTLTRKYFKNFGFEPEIIDSEGYYDEKTINPLIWKLDLSLFESEFEKIVYGYLVEYINSKKPNHNIEIYNQVNACGQKMLDFVLYNHTNKRFVAVEVDGIHHFELDGKTYSQAHLERMDILKRAGWNIVNTPYYKWYNNGWFNENSPVLKQEIERIYKELDKFLIE